MTGFVCGDAMEPDSVIFELAKKIKALMTAHPVRREALKALDIAGTLFSGESTSSSTH
jgi:hypothetical protein